MKCDTAAVAFMMVVGLWTTAAPALAEPAFTFRIDSRETLAGEDGAGAYQVLKGAVIGEVDPAEGQNAIIQDLNLAPRNARGYVEYSTDFILYVPADGSRANGVLQYNTPNRGNLIHYPPDPLFLRRGEVILYAGWQGDVPKTGPERMTLTAPVARNPDGSSITGPYRADLIPTTGATDLRLPGGPFNGTMKPYAPASMDNSGPDNRLSRRVKYSDARIPIANSDWAFAACDASHPFPGKPDPTRICVKGGVDPNSFYEIIYTARDPIVMGLGLAAIRDLVSFLRYEDADREGLANPARGLVRYAIGSGRSQTGNFMKTFIHLGFNEDLGGRRVFDGVYSLVGARLTNVNARFSIPGGGGGARTDFSAPAQLGPRGFAPDYVDNVAGRTGGIFARCSLSDTCPKVFMSWSSSELWALQGSSGLTDAYGLRDLQQPDNLRIYLHSSTQHPDAALPRFNPDRAAYPIGPLATYIDSHQRALFLALEEWVVDGREPPASRIPRIEDGTLVRPDQLRFPAMRGLVWDGEGHKGSIPDFEYRGLYVQRPLLNFGPRYRAEDESGIMDYQPPHNLGRDYAILVPQVDGDGHDIAGVRGIAIEAPLGTNLGFNYAANPDFEDLDNLNGAFIPFHKTRAARVSAGDERPSLEERYGDQAGYVAAVEASARRLVQARFMLQEDADRYIENARRHPVLP
nr:alpha/beta hydrolase domain-containing protein [Brevundimonas diminuta]